MCGINGIFGLESIHEPESIIKKMNQKMAHRGPDNDGIFIGSNVALGHRRLSIIDTTEHSNQPFFNSDKSIVLSFNGEIYNYLELKKELNEYHFQTSSDTEVIMAAYTKWGTNCFKKFNGMFALAIWDTKKEELILCRDRLGIKPLYYNSTNGPIVFSSEIRSLLASNLVPKSLDKEALQEYLRYQTVHSPKTILAGVYSIPPGTFLTINDNERSLTSYWNIANPSSLGNLKDKKEVEKKVLSLLTSSVELRMRADVPFGAFLSGGIDSSAIVGLMSKISTKPVSTFSVVFDEKEFSEAVYAEKVAKLFNTNHHEILLTASHFLDEIPNALSAMDHPSGDGPNTFMVSQATKKAGITMALSGLGGDELFAGYPIFNRSLKLEENKWLSSFAGIFRSAAGNLYKRLKPSVASYKIADILDQEYIDLPHAYSVNRKLLFDKELTSILKNKFLSTNSILERCKELDQITSKNYLGTLSKVSIMEIDTYMQNVLLRDSDQMSMAHSLEVRVPFLDHRLVEFALSLSDELKAPTSPKKLLVDALNGLIPDEIIHRPKMGFVLPWEHWMKNELKEFCETRIKNLSQREYFDQSGLETLWSRFLNGDPLITWSRIWPLVVLENWLGENGVN